MKVNKKKLELAKARACMTTNDIIAAGISKGTYIGALSNKNVMPATAGKLAKVLGVDVTEIIED